MKQRTLNILILLLFISIIGKSQGFHSTRLVNGYTPATISKSHLEFTVKHKFGKLNSDASEFFGLDIANSYLSIDYGISNSLTVGFARNGAFPSKSYDGTVKFNILRQEEYFPFYLTAVGTAHIYSDKDDEFTKFERRLVYNGQILISRSFGEKVAIQVIPSFTHFNYARQEGMENDIFTVGFGGNIDIAENIAFQAEFYPVIMKESLPSDRNHSFSAGILFIKKRHRFQLFLTNTDQMDVTGMMGYTTGNDTRFGFNISTLIQTKKH